MAATVKRTHQIDELEDAAVPPVQSLTPEEARALFEYQARKLMNMSGDEFLRRYDAGEFATVIDGPDHLKLVRLEMLISFVR